MVSNLLPCLFPEPGQHISLCFLGVIISGRVITLVEWLLDTLPSKDPQNVMRRKEGTKRTEAFQNTTGAGYYGY